ncbi:uncharacterized protein LOC131630933 [Vicia villosa]|uniref:uncharacterized protein LOC131630933 n=1 Tax=Vicia villosa TaxID=3911 RepID=UPI00273BDC08|nr:uncharacterized protein LOC131630933 [Vicia villosa]
MKKVTYFHLLFIFFICFFVTTNSLPLPWLSPFSKWKTTLYQQPPTNPDIKTFYYEQVIDHFNQVPNSYVTFKQRYFVNFKYWGGANSSSPIFAYFGDEFELMVDPEDFLTDNAGSFKALLVYIEHRFYGKSIPFGSIEEAYKNTSTMGYFNSAQTLADYADVLLYLKNTLHAQESPVIVMGGSYGGMLAAWFRLKYPHVAVGALASSAPILYFDNIIPENAYFDVFTRDFEEISETCSKFILNSWYEIDKVASQPNGLSILSQKFNTCYPLENTKELKEYLENFYSIAVHLSYPLVETICNVIDGAAFGTDVLSRINGITYLFEPNDTCKVNLNKYAKNTFPIWDRGWKWQTCSEMVMPIAKGNSSMFQPEPFNFHKFAKQCKKDFGVIPRPHWITTYYGGRNIKLVLQKFGSNIIFSNGLKDPYSSGGVLKNLSDSIIALTTVNGTHVMDMSGANEYDPDWLVDQRRKEVKIIKGWLNQYYVELSMFQMQ